MTRKEVYIGLKDKMQLLPEFGFKESDFGFIWSNPFNKTNIRICDEYLEITNSRGVYRKDKFENIIGICIVDNRLQVILGITVE